MSGLGAKSTKISSSLFITQWPSCITFLRGIKRTLTFPWAKSAVLHHLLQQHCKHRAGGQTTVKQRHKRPIAVSGLYRPWQVTCPRQWKCPGWGCVCMGWGWQTAVTAKVNKQATSFTMGGTPHFHSTYAKINPFPFLCLCQVVMWRMRVTIWECVPRGTSSQTQCQKGTETSRPLQLPGNVHV